MDPPRPHLLILPIIFASICNLHQNEGQAGGCLRSLLMFLSAISPPLAVVDHWSLVGVIFGSNGGIWSDAAVVTGGSVMSLITRTTRACGMIVHL